MNNFLIYGANGYTGELITRYALRQRMRMVARQASLDPGDGIEL